MMTMMLLEVELFPVKVVPNNEANNWKKQTKFKKFKLVQYDVSLGRASVQMVQLEYKLKTNNPPEYWTLILI